ncbi:MAG: glycoside hydrolase family 28 protein [Planctomycetota bacterium]|nr:MAG: glycoside hydrolase family 28 protein [Planctomycetota bacterium]
MKRNRPGNNKETDVNKNRITAILATAILSGVFATSAQGARKTVVFSVRDFGAKGDGKTLDSAAIQKALDKCGEIGGGVVRIPKGNYLSGAIFIKSNTTLVIEEGAVLTGSSEEVRDYPVIDSRFAGTEQKSHASLINAIDVHDITITGKGVVAGSGVGGSRPPTGPRVIEFIRCKNVLLENIKVTNTGRWTIHPLYCTNVVIKGLDIRTTGPNADGIDPDSCSNVLITECTFETGDDCIAIKSGKNQQAVDIGIPCENVTITKCTMLGGHACVAIGSEISGGIRNIVVKDCVFKNMHRGFDVKTREGRGGFVENITVENIKTFGIKNAVLMRMDYPGNKGDLIKGPAGISTVRNITCRNIEIHDGGMGSIRGVKESPIQGLTFKNFMCHGNSELKIKNVSGLVIENIRNKNSDKAVTMTDVKLQD